MVSNGPNVGKNCFIQRKFWYGKGLFLPGFLRVPGGSNTARIFTLALLQLHMDEKNNKMYKKVRLYAKNATLALFKILH